MGVLLELVGLTEQQELCKANLIDLTCQLSPRLGQGIGAAPYQLGWSLWVIGAAILGFQRPE
jgi:hypothetical protein